MDEKPHEGWLDFCNAFGDRSVHSRGCYSSDEQTRLTSEEYQLCAKEAAEGNERAQRYMEGFVAYKVALRMTT